MSLLYVSQVTQSSEPLNQEQYKQDDNQIIKDMNTINLEKELIKDSTEVNKYISQLEKYVPLLLDDYYKLNDKNFNILCNKLLSLIDFSEHDKDLEIKFFTLLKTMKKRLNDLIQRCITQYYFFKENNNNKNININILGMKYVLNIIAQYRKIINESLSAITNDEVDNINNKIKKPDIFSNLSIIHDKDEYLSKIYNSFLKDMNQLNNISYNYLHELITCFEDTNILITKKINNILIILIENVIEQNSLDDDYYKKYYNDLKIIKDLDNNDILTINYSFANNIGLEYYLKYIILYNLYYFDETTNIKSLIKNIQICEIYKSIFDDVLDITGQYFSINGNNINPKYVEGYEQMINEFTKNTSQIFEKCKPLINDIENKSKDLHERKETLLNNSSLEKKMSNNIKKYNISKGYVYKKKNVIRKYEQSQKKQEEK